MSHGNLIYPNRPKHQCLAGFFRVCVLDAVIYIYDKLYVMALEVTFASMVEIDFFSF